MKQTSIEWLIEQYNQYRPGQMPTTQFKEVCEQAIKMHKQEIEDAWNGGDYAYFYSKETGRDFTDGSEYYQETFVSKGSDDHISDISKIVELPQQEISDEMIKEAVISFDVPDGYKLEDYSEGFEAGFEYGVEWYRKQLKQRG
jgi:hypothetical protein